MDVDELRSRLDRHPAVAGLRTLVLHGSRSRGDGTASSDWDFAVLPAGRFDTAGFDTAGFDTAGFDTGFDTAGFDTAGLTTALVEILGTDAVDVVDLDRASALLRFRTARDGVAILDDGVAFEAFRQQAVRFWCDAGPVIRAAQDRVLAGLG